MRILLAGGGTGGHTFPLIAVASALKKNAWKAGILDLEMLHIGPDGFSQKLFRRKEIKSKVVLAGKLRRYFAFRNFLDIFKLPVGFFQSLWHVFWFMPDVIFGKGGYGSFPAILVGWLFRIPIIIHESDSTPGLANKILSRFVKRVAVSFKEAEKFFPKEKVIFTGNPIREEILNGSYDTAKKVFNLIGGRETILVLGGSQGAQKINEIILEILPQIIQKYEIIHQGGENNFKIIQAAGKTIAQDEFEKYHHLFPFLDEGELSGAYAAADLIISRAGAGSIFEIAAVRKPSILIPLASAASNHQLKNAYIYQESGSCEVIEEANLAPHFLIQRLEQLFNDPEKLRKMSLAAERFAKPNAAEIIADEILKLGR